MKACTATLQRQSPGSPDQASWLNSGDYEVSPVVGNLDEHQSLPSFLLTGARGLGNSRQDGTVPLSSPKHKRVDGRGAGGSVDRCCFLLKMDLFVLWEVIKTVAMWFVLNVKCFKIVNMFCSLDGNVSLHHLVMEGGGRNMDGIGFLEGKLM